MASNDSMTRWEKLFGEDAETRCQAPTFLGDALAAMEVSCQH